jgi:hypothetical protein
MTNEKKRRVRGFMDGIDWQHHIGVGNDSKGAIVFPSKKQTIALKGCLSKGGRCGVVEVEVRLVRWVVPQRLDLERKARMKKLRATPSTSTTAPPRWATGSFPQSLVSTMTTKTPMKATPSNSRLSRGPMRARRLITNTTAASVAQTAMP